jgi:hypothetical protein
MISERLRELYNLYSSPGAHLVPEGNFGYCGVVDEEKYESNIPKLVCVLKEPNNKRKRPKWSIPEFLQQRVIKGSCGNNIFHMWKVLGIWSYAIHNNFPDYNDINTVQISAEGLRYIGMTNLKKSEGGGKANQKAIWEYSRNTIPLWKSELEIMNSNIILCCGTFGIVTSLLALSSFQTAVGRCYSVWQHGNNHSLILSIYHPACRLNNAKLYTILKEALLELKEKGLWHS